VAQQGRAKPVPPPPGRHLDFQEAEVPVVPVRQLEQVPAADPGRVLKQPGLPRFTHKAGLQPAQENPARHDRYLRIVGHPGRAEDLVAGIRPPPVLSPEPLDPHAPSEPHPIARRH
jgi:hypothetical protein